jgi:hypothetical protein
MAFFSPSLNLAKADYFLEQHWPINFYIVHRFFWKWEPNFCIKNLLERQSLNG